MSQDNSSQDIVYSLVSTPDFAEDGVCFCAKISGMYHSSDYGKTWLSDFAPVFQDVHAPIFALVLSPEYQKDRTLFAGSNGGIFRSTDGGKNWSFITLASPPPLINGLVTSPGFLRDGIVFACSMEDGIFRSGDRGDHFFAWNFGLLDLNVFALAISPGFTNDDTLFTGVETGIFISKNGGRAWRELGEKGAGIHPSEFAPVLSLSVSPNYEEDQTLLAGTEENGLFISRNQGSTWSRIGMNIINGPVNNVQLFSRTNAGVDIVIQEEKRLLISRDLGNTWVDVFALLLVKSEYPIASDEVISTILFPDGLNQGMSFLLGTTRGNIFSNKEHSL